MGSVLLFDMLYALGVAISPTPVILVILMLFGTRGRVNALGFLIGWIVGLFLLGAIIFALVTAGVFILNRNMGIVRPIVLVLAGAGLLYLAYLEWAKPVDPSPDLEGPKWLATADRLLARSSGHLTPLRAFVLAIVMSAISPKNITLMLAAMLALTQANLSPQGVVILFLLFVSISSLTIGVPVGYALIKGDRAEEALKEWKQRIIANSPRAFAILIAIIGIVILVNGLSGISMNLQTGST